MGLGPVEEFYVCFGEGILDNFIAAGFLCGLNCGYCGRVNLNAGLLQDLSSCQNTCQTLCHNSLLANLALKIGCRMSRETYSQAGKRAQMNHAIRVVPCKATPILYFSAISVGSALYQGHDYGSNT